MVEAYAMVTVRGVRQKGLDPGVACRRAGYDVESARLMANECPRWCEPAKPTPDGAWAGRKAIAPEERTAFKTRAVALQGEIRVECAQDPSFALGPTVSASMDREGIARMNPNWPVSEKQWRSNQC
jgi:hypothetical protein